MATADYWSSADMKAVERGGIVAEDVMGEIWDISAVPLPLSDAIGTDSVKNSSPTWTQDKLAAPDITNAVVDGQDNTKNNAKGGARVGNECQISTKAVTVTTRAQNSDMIGASNALAYNIMMRQRELRRDVEAIMCGAQGSQVDDGDTTPGLSAGLAAWMTSNFIGGVGAAAGGYDTGTGLVDAPTPGLAAPITETGIRDIMQSIYELGGSATMLMSGPPMIRRISEYMFTDGARIATLTSDQGKSTEKAAALGAVNVFVTDFGTLTMTANILQQTVDDATPVTALPVFDVFILDTGLIRQGLLHGYRTEPLAKTGLADKRQMAVDWTLKMLNEEGCGVIRDADPAQAMVA